MGKSTFVARVMSGAGEGMDILVTADSRGKAKMALKDSGIDATVTSEVFGALRTDLENRPRGVIVTRVSGVRGILNKPVVSLSYNCPDCHRLQAIESSVGENPTAVQCIYCQQLFKVTQIEEVSNG